MITEELKQAVRREAEKLRDHIDERNKKWLHNGSNPYVQMFGKGSLEHALLLKMVCGLPITYPTPIEMYWVMPEANNKSLISFLKGETETLEL